MVVDPYHRYSNESERANEDIYNDFKLKKNTLGPMVFKKILSALRVKARSYACFYPFEIVDHCILPAYASVEYKFICANIANVMFISL